MFSGSMPLTIDADALVTFAPELDGKLDDDELDQICEWVGDEIDTATAGQRQGDRMALNLAAHIATMHVRAQAGGAGGASTTGPVQSVTIGPVSKTYSVAMTGVTSTASERALGQTAYGLEYQRLVRLFAPRMALT